MHRLTIRRFAVALGLCIATVVATTATSVGTAYADVLAQVYISSGNLTFVDKPGVNNINLTVRTAGGDVQFDAQYTISPLFGCYYPVATDTTKVNCAGTITTLFVYAGDGNDLVDVDLVGAYSTLPDAIMGEGGNDRLYGGPSFTDIHGGPGSDELYGRGGNDGLLGDDGVVGASADKMYGGSGSDDVEYSVTRRVCTSLSMASLETTGCLAKATRSAPMWKGFTVAVPAMSSSAIAPTTTSRAVGALT
jgi:hypothetical protein